MAGGGPVHVMQGGPRGGRLAVQQGPDGPGVAVADAELARADQGHVAEAHLAGGEGGELAGEVVGRGEQDRDQVVVRDLVAFEQPDEQLLGPLQQLLPLVLVDRGGAAQGHQPLVAHRAVRSKSASNRVTSSPPRPDARHPPATGATAPYRPTALYTLRSSSCVSWRCSPGDSPVRRSGPSAVRTRRLTGAPTASSSRRTSRLRPSTMTISTIWRRPLRATIRARSARANPSSSSTPRVRRASMPGGSCSTSARYFRCTP